MPWSPSGWMGNTDALTIDGEHADSEREGKLDSDSSMTLPVPASHLDDALKTLVVVTREGRARVGGVEFASRIEPGATALGPPVSSFPNKFAKRVKRSAFSPSRATALTWG